MQKGRDAEHFFEFLKAGKEEKNEGGEKLTLPGEESKKSGRSISPLEGENSPETDTDTRPSRNFTRVQTGLMTRGRGLSLKYDMAMLVLLALVGLMVIAYLWGYFNGRRSISKNEQESADTVAVMPGDSGGDTADSRPPAESSVPVQDDGPLHRPYYSLQIMEYRPEHGGSCDELKSRLESHNFQTDVYKADGGNLRLFVGRFRKSDSPGAKKFREYFVREYDDCFFRLRE